MGQRPVGGRSVSIRAPFIEQGELDDLGDAEPSKWRFNPRPIHRTGRTNADYLFNDRMWCFNPRPIHRTGRTSAAACACEISAVSIRAPFIEQGERVRRVLVFSRRMFQSAPHSSNRANLQVLLNELRVLCVSIRAPFIEQGEPAAADIANVKRGVSIRAPFIEQGEHAQFARLEAVKGVSIRAPFIEQGERAGAGLVPLSDLFQSAPHSSNRANARSPSTSGMATSFNPRPIHRTGRTPIWRRGNGARRSFNPRPIHRTGRTVQAFKIALAEAGFNPRPIHRTGRTRRQARRCLA